MFYIFSRLFACLASPWIYILILFVCIIIYKSKTIKRISAISICFLLLLFTNKVLFQKALNIWISPYLQYPDTTYTYKYALLPGGFSSYDENRQRIEYGFAVDRLIDAISFYKQGLVKKLVFSGDGATIKQGNKDFFIQHLHHIWGINPKDIIIEPLAQNTYQNIKYTLNQLSDMNSKNTLLINSAIYMKRTLQSCKQLNFHPKYYATDINTTIHIYNWETWIPDFHVMDDWMRLIHEWIGCVAYKLL